MVGTRAARGRPGCPLRRATHHPGTLRRRPSARRSSRSAPSGAEPMGSFMGSHGTQRLPVEPTLTNRDSAPQAGSRSRWPFSRGPWAASHARGRWSVTSRSLTPPCAGGFAPASSPLDRVDGFGQRSKLVDHVIGEPLHLRVEGLFRLGGGIERIRCGSGSIGGATGEGGGAIRKWRPVGRGVLRSPISMGSVASASASSSAKSSSPGSSGLRSGPKLTDAMASGTAGPSRKRGGPRRRPARCHRFPLPPTTRTQGPHLARRAHSANSGTTRRARASATSRSSP